MSKVRIFAAATTALALTGEPAEAQMQTVGTIQTDQRCTLNVMVGPMGEYSRALKLQEEWRDVDCRCDNYRYDNDDVRRYGDLAVRTFGLGGVQAYWQIDEVNQHCSNDGDNDDGGRPGGNVSSGGGQLGGGEVSGPTTGLN